MKINYIKKFLLLFALSAIILSCEEDDQTGDSQIEFSRSTITLTTSSPSVFDESSIDSEDPSTYQITVEATIPEPQPVNAVVELYQTAGTATSSDYSFGKITIPAGYTSASGTVDILQTGDIEGEETLTISGKSVANFDVASFSHDVTIENDYINDQLELTLSWEGSAEHGDLSITSFCDIDFDLQIYDSAFNSLGYVLATSSCPENDVLYGLPDGTYYLVSELYDNPYSGLGYTDAINLTLSWSQEYFEETQGSITSTDFNLGSTPTVGGLIVVLEVTNGYEYTLSAF